MFTTNQMGWVFAWMVAWCLTVPEAEAQVRRVPSPAERDPTEATEPEEGRPENPAGETEESPEEAPATEPASTLFGDPSRFNSFSGWGGLGGAMGQWGMGRSMLIMMPAVQEELELTDEQKDRLRQWQQVMQDRGREMGEQMRDQSREAMSQEGFHVGAILGMMNSMGQILKENESGVARILDADQRRRLDQISMQMEGVTALARPEVARAVRLSIGQSEQIQQVLAQAKVGQIMYWVGQGRRMMPDRNGQGQGQGPGLGRPGLGGRPAQAPVTRRSERQPPSPEPRTTNPAPTGAESHESGPDTANTAQARRNQAIGQFEEMRNGTDRLQQETVQRVLKILTTRQRERYSRLLGEPFDPTQINAGMGQGRGPGGQAPRREPSGETDS